MLFNRRGQSTAEYAIVIGLVVAVAAGVLQVALKGAIRKKNDEALNYLLGAGYDDGLDDVDEQDKQLFSSEHRYTRILADDFEDTSVLNKGGAHKSKLHQKTETESVSIEAMNALNN
jgi:hypothetical protein